MMPQLNFMKTFLCMVLVIVIASCGTAKSKLIRYITKRDSTTTCEGGIYMLKEEDVVEVKPTDKTIEYEAKRANTNLTKAYDEHDFPSYPDYWGAAQEEGTARGLSEDEITAIYLYTMESNLYAEFNSYLRKGVDKYPVFHYWLKKAVDTLYAKGYTYNGPLYRGTGIYFNATLGEKISFSGFTSTSRFIHIAKKPKFLKPGCTFMSLTTKMGVDIANMSAFQEGEVLIPPQEKFIVDKIEIKEGDPPTIYLSPAGTAGTAATNKCTVCRVNYNEAVELVIVALICSFYL